MFTHSVIVLSGLSVVDLLQLPESVDAMPRTGYTTMLSEKQGAVPYRTVLSPIRFARGLGSQRVIADDFKAHSNARSKAKRFPFFAAPASCSLIAIWLACLSNCAK